MKLSIITVNLNNLEGLKKTSESILSQSWKDYEWVIIDGGSTDGSVEYIKSLERQPDKWLSEADKGVYDAMNKGIALVSGDYTIFMNSGDTFHKPSTIEDAMSYDFTEDVVYGDAMFIYKKHPKRWVYDDVMTLKRLYDYSINHQSTFILTSLLKQRGYDLEYPIVADAKRFVEIFLAGGTFRHLPIIISNYDTTGYSTINEGAAKSERERFFKELLPDYALDVLKDWKTFQNKQCRQAREYCNGSKLYRRLIHANLHFITWLNGIFHFTEDVK